MFARSHERPLAKSDTQAFVDVLKERGFHFWGFVVNRVLSRRIGITKEASLEQWVAEIATLTSSFSALLPPLEHEREAARFLQSLSGRGGSVALIPEQKTDVHSVGALLEISRVLA